MMPRLPTVSNPASAASVIDWQPNHSDNEANTTLPIFQVL